MPFVVDAAMALAWCLPGEATEYSDEVLRTVRTTGAMAPSIWLFEVANVLVVSERRGRLTGDEAANCLRFLQSLPITVDSSGGLGALDGLIAGARRHALSVYDAAYLDMASRYGLPLATLDKALASAAIAAGVSLTLERSAQDLD